MNKGDDHLKNIFTITFIISVIDMTLGFQSHPKLVRWKLWVGGDRPHYLNGECMKNRKSAGLLIIALVLSINLFASMALGQYTVGQTISQSTSDKVVSFCANDAGNVSLGSLLEPEQGVPTRVVWLNFFASW